MKQSQALDIMKMGQNVFLTGRAGAGKTFVLNEYIKYLRQNSIPVAVTASTGIAATHLGGITIHSWSGMGIKDVLFEQDLNKLLKKTYLKRHYRENEVLIIDEISMLHAHQLELVNQLCQAFRQSLKPFGGMQVILTGDFFQLPPVGRGGQATKFVVEAEIWKKMGLRVCYLDEQFRQDDQKFLKILNEIRAGKVSQASRKVLNKKINQDFKARIEPTKLYTVNADVDEINMIELGKVSGEPKRYDMTHRGIIHVVEILKKSCLAPERLILKIGAKVMFVKNNYEIGVVNGTLGEVVGFDEFTGYPEVKIGTGEVIQVKPDSWMIDEGSDTLAEIRQFPLRLAWAITVHKSQGMSLDFAEIDLSKAFTYGMGYVALSRVRNLAGLKLDGYNEMALEVDPKILPFDKKLQMMSQNNVKLLKKVSGKGIDQRHNRFIETNSILNMPKKKKKKISNKLRTLELIKEKLSIEKIAKKLNLKDKTIIGHVEKLIAMGEKMSLDYLMPGKKEYKKIKKSFDKHGLEKLKPVYEDLKEKCDYEDLKLVRLDIKNKVNK